MITKKQYTAAQALELAEIVQHKVDIGTPTKDLNTINKRVTKIALLKTKQSPAQISHTTQTRLSATPSNLRTNPKTAISTTTMVSPAETVDVAMAEAEQKGRVRGAESITSSP